MAKAHKVVWSEGMFLNPHHFQQSDRYFEITSLRRLDCILPINWGITEFSIDQDAIKNGILTLDKFKGILPDGSLLDIGESDTIGESRTFQDFFASSVDLIDVFVAIPLYEEDRITCSLDDSNHPKTTRYKREEIIVSDENNASSKQTIFIAGKNIKILFSGESLDGFSTIKVARINRLAEGGYLIDEDYIPPLLKIGASASLMKIVCRILENMSSRSTQLSGKRRQRSTEMADFSAFDITNFLFLQTINSFIPVLNHLYRSGTGSPEQLYKALVQLSGELITFSMEGHPRDLPLYDHADLSGTFSQIDKKLQSLLGKVISSQNFVSIPLERKTENIYEGNIRDDALFVSGIFFLAVEGGDVSQADIIEHIPIKLKISSADTIYDIISSAMPGVGLIHVPIPPPSLPIKVGYEYFKLESTGELWTRARESGKLAIHLPKELVSINIKLIVLKDRK